MNTRLIRAGLAAAMALALAGLTGCGEQAQSRETAAVPAATPVETALVTAGTLEPSYAATTTLEARRAASIQSEQPGEVVAVLVEEGDRVEAGQVLARLDAAKASLQARQIQSVAERLKHEAERSVALLEHKMISQEAHDRAKFERDSQLAAVELARLTVNKTDIRAPYAGVITRRHIKEGQWLTLEAPAFEIADFNQLEARLSVPERQSGSIGVGQSVALAADAFPGQAFEGRVVRTSPVVDRASGTVGVTVAVENPDMVLRPGLFVRLAVSYERIADATLVPKAAVITGQRTPHVFVVEKGVAHSRRVELGLENGAAIQVLSGVVPGATVVTVGHNALKDGDRVAPVNVTAPNASAVAGR